MGIREDLKIPLTMLSINFLNKLPFIGSYKGIRFKFEKVTDDSTDKLKVYVWKDMLNFENTDVDSMKISDFAYSNDGIDEGIKFVEKCI